MNQLNHNASIVFYDKNPIMDQCCEVNAEYVLNVLNRPDVKIIDTRPVDNYNGWPENDEIRGGHIRGAKSLPYKWTRYIDWIEMVRFKNILPEHQLIIYGSNREQTDYVANRFIGSGYKQVFVYHHFHDSWLSDNSKPLDKLARFDHLVSATWLNQLISGKKPNYSGTPFVIVHAHYRNPQAYLSGHIPGAIDMDTMALEEAETWNRRKPSELEEALLQHGITSNTTVILYGKFMYPDNRDPFPGSAAGDIGAMRCAMIMLYAGVKDVKILNGGFQSWQDEGFEISTIDEPKTKAIDFGVRIPANPQYIVDTPQAKQMLASSNAELVCVRSWPEYIGEVSGYNYIEKKGRIPGAIFADCGSDAYHMENYRNFDHTLREYHEIEAIWAKNGIVPEKHLAFYCGTGWRGSEAWFNAWLMGWPRVSVYDGGWYEWSADQANPTEVGIPEQYVLQK